LVIGLLALRVKGGEGWKNSLKVVASLGPIKYAMQVFGCSCCKEEENKKGIRDTHVCLIETNILQKY
jgi:hypothetical protein